MDLSQAIQGKQEDGSGCFKAVVLNLWVAFLSGVGDVDQTTLS